jgi:hypothetical protein
MTPEVWAEELNNAVAWARNQALEEAARVADMYGDRVDGAEIAAAIRALKNVGNS